MERETNIQDMDIRVYRDESTDELLTHVTARVKHSDIVIALDARETQVILPLMGRILAKAVATYLGGLPPSMAEAIEDTKKTPTKAKAAKAKPTKTTTTKKKPTGDV